MHNIRFFIIISIVILFSSCYTTHVSTMLNEPAFEKAGEVQASGAVGLDHIEGQAAVSVTNHIGLVGGAYRAFKETKIYEGGINIYTPLDKKKKNYFSVSFGALSGQKNKEQYVSIPIIDNKKLNINTKYNGIFVQFAYSFKTPNNIRNNKTIFLAKSEMINYSEYNLDITNYSGTGYYFYKINFSAKDRKTNQTRLAVIHHRQKTGRPFYWQFQFGLTIMNGFKIDEVNTVFGNYKTDTKQDYENMIHAKAYPLFLNIAFGIKI